MKKPFKHELGIEAKEIVTGFTGIVTSRTEHITGCNTYGVQPKAVDGKVCDMQWFDENRLEKTGEGVTIEQHNDGAGPEHPQQHKTHK